MQRTLRLVSAGAAKGLVEALAGAFRHACAADIDGAFGAVGAMKERLQGGAPCDVVILTAALVRNLADDGTVQRDTIASLGRVATGIAVREGDARPALDSADALQSSLAGATSVYFPDPARATAGIHFMNVLDRLGLRASLQARLRPFPNGATAMAELARAADAQPIGCTQVTEILYTDGVALAGPLPTPLDLVTEYSAAVASRTTDRELALAFVALLTGPETRALRERTGFGTGDQ